MREYPTLKALRNGETVDLGGILVRMDEGEIKPGDPYVAERNTGPKLLTAAKIVGPGEGPGGYGGWIRATSNDYSFDIGECVKVREA